MQSVQLFTRSWIKATMGRSLTSQDVVAAMTTVVQNDFEPGVSLPGLN